MKLRLLLWAGLLLACSFIPSVARAQQSSTPFSFQFEGKTLHGLIEKPAGKEPSTMVVIIPGYGRTKFVEGRSFRRLRDSLVNAGLAVCVWDKMGCGKSEGEFDAQQPVSSSAREAVAAMQELKRLGETTDKKTGMWGISRAGWICPLIYDLMPFDFWISASGAGDKENYGYLLYTNLLIAGKSEAEALRLYNAWQAGHELFSTGGSYEENIAAIRPLLADSMCRRLFGYAAEADMSEEAHARYTENQAQYTQTGHFDAESGLWVYLPNFGDLLANMKCPVLALFGEKDSQIDWRDTRKLYQQHMGSNLAIKVFVQCNHSLKECVSCAYREDLTALQWRACEGYYDTMIDWMRKQGFLE